MPDPELYESLVRVMKGDLRRLVGQCYRLAARDRFGGAPEWLDKIVASGHGDAIDTSARTWEEFKARYLEVTEKLVRQVAQEMLFNPEAELEISLSLPGDCNFAAHVWTLRSRIKPVPAEDFVFIEPAPVEQKPPIKFDFLVA